MRCCGGVRTEAHQQAGVELDGEVHHGVGEAAPVVVGFGAVQDEERRAFAVGRKLEIDLGPGEPGVHAIVEVHHRPPRPMVEQLFGVEAGHHPRTLLGERRGDTGDRGCAGIDPPLEMDEEDRPVDIGPLDQFEQRTRSEVGHNRLAISSARLASNSTRRANDSIWSSVSSPPMTPAL
ncbi:unannotated protein [freshwater metagenome]|uniref:Unannotated protein n=1 Tax=freshwater metagenome TaxID=449393 RepID=A0A6J7P791_9ZZZZ